MTLRELRARFGEEYPAAILDESIRMPLAKETRFMRIFSASPTRQEYWISRFMDESASISAEQLMQEWPNWDDNERFDFCRAAAWLAGQADFPTILRFVMEHGDAHRWSELALSVAGSLPQAEAFDLLKRALTTVELGRSANLCQAIAHTKHPEAGPTLALHLDRLWSQPKLWDDDAFENWVAFDVTCCIQYLIELGMPPKRFEDKVGQLAKHKCSGNRDTCQRYLGKYYPWLEAEKMS